MPKVKLTVDSYDLLRDPEDASKGTIATKGRGDIVDVSKAEAERLIEIGAAVDEKAENERQRERLEQQRQKLEAERQRIESELGALDQPQTEGERQAAALKGKALNDALKEHGLPTEGSDDDKRARLAGVIDSQPPQA